MAERDPRLREVSEAQLTESRVNEDFVEWLRTKGPSWLLMILILIGGYLGVLRWKQYRTGYLSDAWAALADSELPGSLEDVAVRYVDVRGLPQQAMRLAADRYLGAVQAGRPLGAEPGADAASLGDEEREQYLDHAERLYRAVADTDDGTLAMTLHAVNAIEGLAAVAESRGDAEEAQDLYEQAAERAARDYPHLADWALARAGTAAASAAPVVLPKRAQLPDQPASEPLAPVIVDDSLRRLLPDEPG